MSGPGQDPTPPPDVEPGPPAWDRRPDRVIVDEIVWRSTLDPSGYRALLGLLFGRESEPEG
jgi:hypothetical protein